MLTPMSALKLIGIYLNKALVVAISVAPRQGLAHEFLNANHKAEDGDVSSV